MKNQLTVPPQSKVTEEEALNFFETVKDKWPEKTRPNHISRIPYGYKTKEGDPLSLVPIPEDVFWIEQALDAMDRGISLREAALWLYTQTEKLITHAGLGIIWKRLRDNPDNPRSQRNKAIKLKVIGYTPEKRKRRRLNEKIAREKTKKTHTERRLNALLEQKKKEEPTIVTPVEYEELPENKQEETVYFRPNEGPQSEFLSSWEQEVLYGGAAGGGKSYAMLADPVRYFENPNFSGLLLRKTNDELRELITKSQFMYTQIYPKAKWSAQKSVWTFPSGATLWMTYLDRDEDVQRYLGQAFTWVGFDELTQYPTPYAWNFLRSRLRDPSGTLPLVMRATTNPGGPGHGWVKKMFIDPAPVDTTFPATNEHGEVMTVPMNDPDFPPERWGKPLFYRRFIPARLSDNPYLSKGGQYKANLLSLPEHLQRQMLEGDWSIAEGAAFPEFRIKTHVIPKADIPHEWRRFRSCDFGYSSWSAVHWYAIDPADEALIVYRELYVTKHTGRDLAKRILELEKDERISYGVLDSSCWMVRGNSGPTIAEEMIAEGCRWRPSDRTQHSRIAGRNRLHELLKVDERTGRPGILFMDNCRQIISDLQVIPTDPDGTDDIDDRYKDDHAYDSIRYGIQSRPRSGYDPYFMKMQELPYNPSDRGFGY